MSDPRTRRNRWLLVAMALLFLTPPLLAALLYFGGWEPARTRHAGVLVQPPLELADLALARADGELYAWRPQDRIWRIAVLPPVDCGDCAELAKSLHLVWQLLGRHAASVEVLWFGPVPEDAPEYPAFVPMQLDSALLERLPQSAAAAAVPVDAATAQSASIQVYLIDPRGFLAMRYPPGFDVAGLRADLARLLKSS